MGRNEACGCGAHGGETPRARGVTRRAVLQAGAATGAATAVAPVLHTRRFRGAQLHDVRRAAAPRTNWPVPGIVTRAEWGANEALRKAGLDYDSSVTKMIVHHTVTPNDPADPAAQLRSIYEYHVGGVYLDIAYNWLIDHKGRIYEGRWARDYPAGEPHTGELADGRQVRGGHSLNTNPSSCGVALLGTFTSAVPSDAALEALVTLLTWKCARWGVDPKAADVYAPDGRVFANICGHRDTSSTECPGGPFYALLPEIRQRIADRLTEARNGYWISTSSGAVVPFGDLPDLGDLPRGGVHAAVQGVMPNPQGVGYWLLGTDGGVFTFGDTQFHGSTGGMRLNKPVVGMAPTPSGGGYWLVASDGGIFSFGDAQFYGSTGAIRLNKPVVGMAATPSGDGYWLVASDGGIFSFGDAQFYGSTGGMRLNKPIVGMAPSPSGGGYWLVASDGGIFGFGDARFLGSTGAITLNQPIVGMATTPTGAGYWLLARDGGIFTFGDAPFHGSAAGRVADAVGVAARIRTTA